MQFRGFRALLFIFTAGALAGLPFCAGAVQRYQIDREKSGMVVFTDSAGMFKAFGEKLAIEVREFSGTLQFDPASVERSSLRVKVPTHSLALKTKVSALDRENIETRMHENVLETLRFPEIEFVSEKVEVARSASNSWQVVLYGRLSLHGVTRRFPIRAAVILRKGQLEAAGEIPLKQSDFKIKPYAYTGGALRVADTVKISFNIVAHEIR